MHDFDQLPALVRQIVNDVRPEDLSALHRIRKQLFVNADAFEEITAQTAQDWAHRLSERVRSGSRSLGEAIVFSGEAADSGDLQAAKIAVNRFLNTCDMPFYRDIAEDRLREYESEE